jgi:hypothetical protein
MVILFGSTFSGGTKELISSHYGELNYFAPDNYFDEKSVLKSLEYKKDKLPLHLRLFRTIKFLKSIRNYEGPVYLTHSIQSIILPLIFYKKNFIWITQGIEIFYNRNSYLIFRHPFFLLIDSYKNLKVSVVNILLHDFFRKNTNKLNISSDPFIDIKINYLENPLKVRTKNKIGFVLLRDEICKNSQLAIKLINNFKSSDFSWIVVDMSKSMSDTIHNNQCVIHKGPIEKQIFLKHLSSANFLLYPSYFEGFGLVINEAISVRVKPIVGPLSLFASHPDVICVKSYRISEWVTTLKNL